MIIKLIPVLSARAKYTSKRPLRSKGGLVSFLVTLRLKQKYEKNKECALIFLVPFKILIFLDLDGF